MTIYYELIKKKQDIIKHFHIEPKLLEDCNILFACYDTGNYEGQAFILYEKDKQLYEVTAFHDSCNDLKGQWEPEETNIDLLKFRFKKGNLSYFVEKHGHSVRHVLNDLQNIQPKKKFKH